MRLAVEIHSLLCSAVVYQDRCKHWKEGTSHWNFYHYRAENLMVELTPIVGLGRVREVVRICIGELHLLVCSVF